MTAVRVCPKHRRILDEVGDLCVCPVGEHVVTRWLVLDKENGRTALDAGRGMEGVVELAKTGAPAPDTKGKTRTLLVCRYTAKGHRLYVRLVAIPARGLWRVGWKQEGKTKAAGWIYSGSEEAAARDFYREARKRAQLRGWVVDETLGRCGRDIAFKEIPAA